MKATIYEKKLWIIALNIIDILLDIDEVHQTQLMLYVNGGMKSDIRGSIKKKFFIQGEIGKTQKLKKLFLRVI
jgi:hypothetical protein